MGDDSSWLAYAASVGPGGGDEGILIQILLRAVSDGNQAGAMRALHEIGRARTATRDPVGTSRVIAALKWMGNAGDLLLPAERALAFNDHVLASALAREAMKRFARPHELGDRAAAHVRSRLARRSAHELDLYCAGEIGALFAQRVLAEQLALAPLCSRASSVVMRTYWLSLWIQNARGDDEDGAFSRADELLVVWHSACAHGKRARATGAAPRSGGREWHIEPLEGALVGPAWQICTQASLIKAAAACARNNDRQLRRALATVERLLAPPFEMLRDGVEEQARSEALALHAEASAAFELRCQRLGSRDGA